MLSFVKKSRYPSYTPKSSLHFFGEIPENWETSYKKCKVDMKDAKKPSVENSFHTDNNPYPVFYSTLLYCRK